jgi:hypothetical protein
MQINKIDINIEINFSLEIFKCMRIELGTASN